MYLMPEHGQYGPKHVACVDETDKICCVWQCRLINSYHDESKEDELHRN